MAQVKKTVEVPAQTRTYVDHVICDLCGDGTTNDDNWGGLLYEVDSVKVQSKKGECYPDNGNHVTTTVDICPACFHGKLLPWLELQGAKPRTEEVDW